MGDKYESYNLINLYELTVEHMFIYALCQVTFVACF